MANRPVFWVKTKENDFVQEEYFEFKWYPGFAISQKQKCISELHNEATKINKGKSILEISSKSTEEYGVKLSTFNLMLKNKSGEDLWSVECLFQGCKKFEDGGPYLDIFNKTSREAKKDERLKTSGKLIGFQFNDEEWQLEPKTLFYDWIYINAVYQNKELRKEIIKYDGFTDIEFNPKKSINNQARAAALYVALYRDGYLENVIRDKEVYVRIIKDKGYKVTDDKNSSE